MTCFHVKLQKVVTLDLSKLSMIHIKKFGGGEKCWAVGTWDRGSVVVAGRLGAGLGLQVRGRFPNLAQNSPICFLHLKCISRRLSCQVSDSLPITFPSGTVQLAGKEEAGTWESKSNHRNEMQPFAAFPWVTVMVTIFRPIGHFLRVQSAWYDIILM